MKKPTPQESSSTESAPRNVIHREETVGARLRMGIALFGILATTLYASSSPGSFSPLAFLVSLLASLFFWHLLLDLPATVSTWARGPLLVCADSEGLRGVALQSFFFRVAREIRIAWEDIAEVDRLVSLGERLRRLTNPHLPPADATLVRIRTTSGARYHLVGQIPGRPAREVFRTLLENIQSYRGDDFLARISPESR